MQKTNRKRLLLKVALFLLITFLIHNFWQDAENQIGEKLDTKNELLYANESSKVAANYSASSSTAHGKNSACGEKWIILTTIQYATADVKYLSDALYGWCVVVAGDKKTPTDWSYKFIIYLSIDEQLKMAQKYDLVRQIPFNSYLRKMVAYLYAIEQGAKYIYETDDDNAPMDGLFGFRYEHFNGVQLENCHSNSDLTFLNPYSYFGQPSMWPRGFPLELIGSTNSNYCKKYKIFDSNEEKYPIPLVQQGLVNGDPDMDAIYRLTRKFGNELLNVKFDENAPSLVLNNRQYAPINSQNTLYQYDAFWSLVFPLQVTFREVDILRGYVSIRLLQEIEGKVAFLAPNAFQTRNSHSYHKDYVQEKRLYEDIYAFVSALDEFKCDQNDALQVCLLKCVQMLIEKKFFDQKELAFYALWIKSLDKLGYKWPKRSFSTKSELRSQDSSLMYKSVEQMHSSNSNQNEESVQMKRNHLKKVKYIEQICKLELKSNLDLPKADNLILLTSIDSESDLEYLNWFLSAHFSYVIACVDENLSKAINFTDYLSKSSSMSILISNNENESFQACVNKAFRIGFKQQAFLIAKSVRSLSFWSENLNFVQIRNEMSASPFQFDSNNSYFVRRNVANGIRRVEFGAGSTIQNYCKFLSNKQEALVLSSLRNAIDSLLWHQNDLASEYCQNLESKTIWMPDFHDGPRVDFTSTLVHLGQVPILAGTKGYNSPFPDAIKLAKLSAHVSNYVVKYATVNMRQTSEQLVKENYEFYKNNLDFENVDFVLCSFTASLCEGFLPLNKTIIINPAHRYNIGRCSRADWSKFNENLLKLKAKNKLIVSAMSKYDEEYMFHFTGMRMYRLYAYAGFYAKNVTYSPVRSEILVGPTNYLGAAGKNLLAELKKLSAHRKFSFKHIREIYGKYSLQDLANHRAIVLFPYAVMSYSIVDFYASNLPIFVPSVDFLVRTRNVDDRSIRFDAYCGNVPDLEPHETSLHKFSPNDDSNNESVAYWLKYADYFHWPHVTVFGSFEDLFHKLETINLREISEKMRQFNKIKETFMIDNWCKILRHDTKYATIPNSYEEAMDYFQIERVHLS